jgi:hypothetical protein
MPENSQGLSSVLLGSGSNLPKAHTPNRTPSPREKVAGKQYFLVVGRERTGQKPLCPGFKTTDRLTSRRRLLVCSSSSESCPHDVVGC